VRLARAPASPHNLPLGRVPEHQPPVPPGLPAKEELSEVDGLGEDLRILDLIGRQLAGGSITQPTITPPTLRITRVRFIAYVLPGTTVSAPPADRARSQAPEHATKASRSNRAANTQTKPPPQQHASGSTGQTTSRPAQITPAPRYRICLGLGNGSSVSTR